MLRILFGMPAGQPLAHTWIFGISTLPWGLYNGLVITSLPYLLRRGGVPVDRIATVVAVAVLPIAWSLFLGPVVDFGGRRKLWMISATALSATCVGVTLMIPMSRVGLITAVAFAGCAFAVIAQTANAAIAAVVTPNHLRGRASGWMNAGNLGGTGLGGAVTLALAERAAMPVVALVSAAMLFGPSLAILAISTGEQAGVGIRHQLRSIFSEVWRTLRLRRTVLTALILVSPAGAGAAMNLLSAVAVDYHVGSSTVIWLTGLGGAILSTAGSLLGGTIADRIRRPLAYILFGFLSAASAIVVALSPVTAGTFIAGASVYLLITGLCYAGYYALVLETIGGKKDAAGTQYALFNGLGNLPVAYMTVLDGVGYAHWGPRGLTAVDGIVGLAAAAALMTFVLPHLRAFEAAGLRLSVSVRENG